MKAFISCKVSHTIFQPRRPLSVVMSVQYRLLYSIGCYALVSRKRHLRFYITNTQAGGKYPNKASFGFRSRKKHSNQGKCCPSELLIKVKVFHSLTIPFSFHSQCNFSPTCSHVFHSPDAMRKSLVTQITQAGCCPAFLSGDHTTHSVIFP